MSLIIRNINSCVPSLFESKKECHKIEEQIQGLKKNIFENIKACNKIITLTNEKIKYLENTVKIISMVGLGILAITSFIAGLSLVFSPIIVPICLAAINSKIVAEVSFIFFFLFPVGIPVMGSAGKFIKAIDQYELRYHKDLQSYDLYSRKEINHFEWDYRPYFKYFENPDNFQKYASLIKEREPLIYQLQKAEKHLNKFKVLIASETQLGLTLPEDVWNVIKNLSDKIDNNHIKKL